MYNGIVNIKKEAGYTSFDVVAVLRGIFGQRKIGHTGTLDPDATGVLVVCLGSAAKICDMLTEKDKEYVAELLLGRTTDTQDIGGTVISERELLKEDVDMEEVKRKILSFVGECKQTPPMYSALKVDGKKLCDLARKGIEVERKARTVQIKSIEILQVDFPVVKIKVVCSKGTYIRTLCHDIGEETGLGGCMKSLVRTRVERFRIEDALTLKQVQEKKDAGRLSEIVLPVDSVFDSRQAVCVKESFQKLLENGNKLPRECMEEEKNVSDGEWVRVYGNGGNFKGIYSYDAGQDNFRAVKILG